MALLDELAGWLRPRHRLPRKVLVPDFRGMRVGDSRHEALRAGVKIHLTRLIDNPAPVEGIIIDQQPSAGTRVKRGCTVNVSVFHEPALD